MPDAVADQPGVRSRMDRLRAGRHCAITTGVQVEIFRGQFSAAFDRHWDDLLSRADLRNVFMHPGVLNAAAPARRLTALLAWEQAPSGKRLVGLWAFATGKPHLSVLPISALCAPATEHAYLSAPVIDRDCLEPTLHAMLEAVAEARGARKYERRGADLRSADPCVAGASQPVLPA